MNAHLRVQKRKIKLFFTNLQTSITIVHETLTMRIIDATPSTYILSKPHEGQSSCAIHYESTQTAGSSGISLNQKTSKTTFTFKVMTTVSVPQANDQLSDLSQVVFKLMY